MDNQLLDNSRSWDICTLYACVSWRWILGSMPAGGARGKRLAQCKMYVLLCNLKKKRKKDCIS